MRKIVSEFCEVVSEMGWDNFPEDSRLARDDRKNPNGLILKKSNCSSFLVYTRTITHISHGGVFCPFKNNSLDRYDFFAYKHPIDGKFYMVEIGKLIQNKFNLHIRHFKENELSKVLSSLEGINHIQGEIFTGTISSTVSNLYGENTKFEYIGEKISNFNELQGKLCDYNGKAVIAETPISSAWLLRPIFKEGEIVASSDGDIFEVVDQDNRGFVLVDSADGRTEIYDSVDLRIQEPIGGEERKVKSEKTDTDKRTWDHKRVLTDKENNITITIHNDDVEIMKNQLQIGKFSKKNLEVILDTLNHMPALV